jgi:type II secretory pathway predicted ATPase ExeA
MATQADRIPKSTGFATTTTDAIWLGPTQQAGLTHLCAETQIKTLIGPSSCGKTTLLQHFEHHLDDAKTLHIPGPVTEATEVLSALLKAASLEVTGLTENEQRNLLKVFIERQGLLGTRIIVCADDVAGFSDEAWRELESLLVLKASRKHLVELAIVGTHDDETNSCLNRVVGTGSTSAVEAIRYLSPPNDDDIRRYIGWKLEQLNIQATFSDEAYGRIYDLSENRFAAVNDLCDTIISSSGIGSNVSFGADAVDRAADFLAESSAADDPAELAADLAANAEFPNRLVISRNGKLVRVVPLDRRLLIGRGENSDLKLASQYLSRHHAMISSTGDGRFIIVDLNSSNGVAVNGERVRRCILQNGDTVALAQYRLKFENRADNEVAAAAAN